MDRNPILLITGWLAAAVGLYVLSTYNYLLFHSLAEIFSIIIAGTIFALAWTSRRVSSNNYLLFIAICYLFVGGIDLVHTLAYKGMGVFPDAGGNLPTQLWIAGRYAQSLSLLIAPYFLRRRLRPGLVFLACGLITTVLLSSILAWNIFPTAYVDGVGLSAFKKNSEYLISLILLASMALLYRNREEFDSRVLRFLLVSVALTIGAELAFTFYIGVYDISNLIGHFFKIGAFYLVYEALVVTGFVDPITFLFNDLERNREALQASHDELEEKVAARTSVLNATMERISALRTIDSAIAGSVDRRHIYGVILDQVVTQLNVDAATILVFDDETRKMGFSLSRGFKTDALKHTRLALGEGYAGLAALERKFVGIPDLDVTKNGMERSPLLKEEGFVSYFAAPLVAKWEVRGVIEIFHRSRLTPDQTWIEYFETIAGQAAIAIDNLQLFEGLWRKEREIVAAYDDTLSGWARTLEIRDYETKGHSERVTSLTMNLAKILGFPEEEIVNLQRGALLHDIGKLAISDTILLKPGPLSDQEWVIMRRHPTIANEVLSPIDFLRPALDIPYCHHERWDGTGYPRGLHGEEIPLAARVFTVVDVWDALNSDRPYRPAWRPEMALGYMQGEAGKHFDPDVVEEFLNDVIGDDLEGWKGV